jgi:PLD-like domain
MADVLRDSLVYDHVWTKIAKVINHSSKRMVVVSYVTSKSLIRFKKGDVLICDASPHAISTGQTNAKLLNDLFKLGVNVFSRSKLHSKIIVLDKAIIVGSANISDQSSSQLFETVLISRSNKIRKVALSMVSNLKTTSDQLNDISILKLLKIQVKRFGFPVNSGRRKKSLLNALKENDVLLDDYIFVMFEEGKMLPDNQIRKEAKKRNLPLPSGENWERFEEDYTSSLFKKQKKLYDVKHKKIIAFNIESSEDDEIVTSFKSITGYVLAFVNQFKYDNQLITNLRMDRKPPFSLSKDSKVLCDLLNKKLRKDSRLKKSLWSKEGWYIKPNVFHTIISKQSTFIEKEIV